MKRNIFLRFLSFALTFLILFTASGCKDNVENSSSGASPTTEQSHKKDYLTLLYSAADTFNPYTAKTDINRQICQLIFDPLVRLDDEFNPVNKIAKIAVVSGKTCSVTINQVRFSDGSMLTADDVVYSYKLAKNSAGLYAASLYEVKSVSAKDSSTIIFNLTKADPYFVNNLTFPIIKAGSEKVTDSDSVLQPPIGSGRYKVSEDKLSLTINENYFGENGNINMIKLINAPDIDSVAHYVEVGAADIYYNSISDGNILRMSGKKLDIPLNNLVYIGINQNYSSLANVTLRQAMSSGIDRKKICNDSFYNNAVAANGFFNPLWNATKSVQNIQTEANSQITIENLEKIGYNVLDNEGKRKNKAGEKLRFTLLVNSENRLKAQAAALIANQLSQYGITVTIVEKHYAAYLEALKKGDFQLYLGEIKISDNMDISSLVLPEGSAAFGVEKEEESKTEENEEETEENTEENVSSFKPADIVNGFYSGQNTLADLASVLQTNMPFVPVCYRTGALFCNDSIENVENSSESDIYFSITEYNNYQ